MRPYVHFKTYQKVISTFLVICFLTIPLTVLTLPKKAGATCPPFPNLPIPSLSVPVHADTTSVQEQTRINQQSEEYFKTCILDGIATLIAKTIIQALTKSIVTWINSGFKGNPSFVQNPIKFFSGIADKVAGNVIEGIAPFLCSPFRLNIQLALATSISSPGDDLSCTLTDVENNFNNFVDSSVGSGSWDNWFNITQNPQNNPYGAMLIAQNKMKASIETAQGKYQMQLDWGKGFLSFEDCSSDNDYWYSSDPNDKQVYYEDNQPVYGVQAGDNNCVTKTPGAVIESQLENTIGSDLRGLELAQSIDQIVAALVGQLMTQALGGIGGLLGANSGSSNSGSSNIQIPANVTIPNIPIVGSCMPSTSKAQIGDLVTWSVYAPNINGDISYEWFGDEGISLSNTSSATALYTSNGTKTASVIVSTSGTSPQSMQINCMPSVNIGNTGTTPTISCAVSKSTVSLSNPTAVTWQAVVLGGTPPFTYTWEGTDGLTSTSQSAVKSYDTEGVKTATVSIYGADGNTFKKDCPVVVNVIQ
jgi:hypothetical protein